MTALITVLVGAAILGVLSYPSFPSAAPVSPPDGAALLARAVQAHGGMEAFHQSLPIEADLTDRWDRWFEAFSFWPGYSTEAEAIVTASGSQYRTRLGFRDGSAWGFDGSKAWVSANDRVSQDSPVLPRARYASWTVPRLMLAPFAIALEAVNVSALTGEDGAPVIEARLSRPGRTGQDDRWLLVLDPATHRVKQVVFQSAAVDPGVIESCTVVEESTLGRIVLPKTFDCRMSNRLSIPLHTMTFAKHRTKLDTPIATFSPPQILRPQVKAGDPVLEAGQEP